MRRQFFRAGSGIGSDMCTSYRSIGNVNTREASCGRSPIPLRLGTFLRALGTPQILSALKCLSFALALARFEKFCVLWRENVFLKETDSARARPSRNDQILVLLAESSQLFKIDVIDHAARSEYMPASLQQTPVDPAADLGEFHSQMDGELTESHHIPAHLRMVVPVQEVIEALCLIAEPQRGGLDAVVRDVLDELFSPFAIKSLTRDGPGPWDTMPGHEIPTCALVFPGQGRQLFANCHRVFILLHDLDGFWRKTPPGSALADGINRGRRHTSPQCPYTHKWRKMKREIEL